MEATITRSDALNLAPHKNAQNRRAFFEQIREAALSRPRDPRTAHKVVPQPARHRDNGR